MALSSNPVSRRKCRSPVLVTTVRLISTTTSVGSHLGSFGKRCQNFWETRYNLAGQRLVVEITLDGAGTHYLADGCCPRRVETDQLIAHILVTRDITHRDIDSFLKELMGLGVIA